MEGIRRTQILSIRATIFLKKGRYNDLPFVFGGSGRLMPLQLSQRQDKIGCRNGRTRISFSRLFHNKRMFS